MDVPLFYILKRSLPFSEVDSVVSLLSITPCQAAVVSDLADAALAWNFAPQVLRAADDLSAIEAAKRWALATGRPLLVLGEAEFLDAVYEDGRREPLASAC